MTGCTRREHDGVRYLYVDYRGLDDEGGVPVLFEAARIVAGQDGPVRMLSDLTGGRGPRLPGRRRDPPELNRLIPG